MTLQSTSDIPLLITVPSPSPDTPPQLSAERRINPSWTVSQLKAKLEPVTGIPPACQHLRTRQVDGSWTTISGDDRQIADWPLRRGDEIEIHDTRPPSQHPNFNPAISTVEKYMMPTSQYETLTDSVLHWKRTHGLGRFDPNVKSAAEIAAARAARDESEMARRGIEVGKRCRVSGDDARRGVVRFVGEVEGLGGGKKERGARWVGVEFDEPVGRNDGSVVVKVDDGEEEEEEGERKIRLFECQAGFGVLVMPEKVQVGEEWVPLDDLGIDEDMEEL